MTQAESDHKLHGTFCFSLLKLAPTWKTHLQLPVLALATCKTLHQAESRNSGFCAKWQKWGKNGEWANCDGIEGGMWQRQEREGGNNWLRTSWELCLNLQPHALHINSYNSYRELYTCQAGRWSTCKHWHGHAAACACACARRTCWAHVPRTLINVSGMWSG